MTNNHNSSNLSINGQPLTSILSRLEAAKFLSVSTRTFDRIQKEKAIPWVYVGRRRKFLVRDLEAYLMSSRSV